MTQPAVAGRTEYRRVTEVTETKKRGKRVGERTTERWEEVEVPTCAAGNKAEEGLENRWRSSM